MSINNAKIYLDYAAATPVDRRVSKIVSGISVKFFGNPSSVHNFGSAAKKVMEDERKKVAGVLGVKPGEVFFTSSGTESDNLAILGAARFYKNKGRHIIVSAIEHLAVLNSCKVLEQEGFKITYLPVGKEGIIDPESVKKAITKSTILISIMQANNEIGTIQPIKEISRIIYEWRKNNNTNLPYFHTDSCQAAGFLNIRPHALGVDLMTFNGAKIYGPKGVGCLYKKSEVGLTPLLFGGSQEKGLRAGTENIALATGLALALEISENRKETEVRRLENYRDWLIGKCLKEIPDVKLNGDAGKRLPNNINLSFRGVDGEMLVLALNQKGFAVSTGSACTTSETGPSHVISAIGTGSDWGNIRISLGRGTSQNELKSFFSVLKREVARIRKQD
ncbi:MAG: cysteine desulfurase [Candidatus Yanofskybacteria bacterium]|nr:cysteine desulfurase [Candidatus Yanofskybacteria bacterium]